VTYIHPKRLRTDLAPPVRAGPYGLDARLPTIRSHARPRAFPRISPGYARRPTHRRLSENISDQRCRRRGRGSNTCRTRHGFHYILNISNGRAVHKLRDKTVDGQSVAHAGHSDALVISRVLSRNHALRRAPTGWRDFPLQQRKQMFGGGEVSNSRVVLLFGYVKKKSPEVR